MTIISMIGYGCTTKLKQEFVWHNRWLSHGGKLVLVKSVLESILVYQMSIAQVPKGILNKIRKKCFNLLWTGKRAKKGIPLVKWNELATAKDARR